MTIPQIPERPVDVGLPDKFSSFRTAQVAAAMRIMHAFQETDNVILQAPPGVGKTLLSLLLARLASKPREPEGRYEIHGTSVATVTKLLQQQYLDDFPDDVVTATGRDNWPCLIDMRSTAANAACNHGWKCPVQKRCDYFVQRDEADEADVSVLNTAFYIFEKAFTSKFSSHDLVIFDEAHALEEAILGFAGKYVGPRLFERLGYTMPRSLELRDDGPWADFWEANADDLRRERRQMEEDARAQLESGAVSLDPRTAGRLRDLKAILDIYGAFKQAFADPEHWLLSRKDDALLLRSIWGYTQAGIVFSGRAKRLFMTGTVLSPEFLAFTLGLKDYRYIELGSDFPAAQRPLYYVPTVKMSAGVSSTDLDHLVMTMDEIIRARHLGQKGIIHTVSYQLRNEIMDRSRWKAFMVTHNAQDRIETLERFRELPDGYILVSPSMTTGVDLPADQCRWQMIPKMPFPYLGDEMVRMRKDDERRLLWAGRDVKVGDLYYAWATATAIVQAYGRAMRSQGDWGHTYLLDSNFGSFVSENRWGPLFPGWFKEALRWTQFDELGIEL